MRRLTLVGFLQSYVRALSGRDTLSLRRLASSATTEPRLVEPLLLWAAVTDRAERLSPLLESRETLQHELRALARLHDDGLLEDAFAQEDPRLRPEYAKVWRSYVARRDAMERDKDVRLEARKRVLELEARTGVSRYRMAKDLGLNPGNLHAYLAQSVPTKLSLDRVAELVRYLEAV